MKRILFAMSLMAATTASFAQVAKPMEDVNHVIDNTVDESQQGDDRPHCSWNQQKGQQSCTLPDRQLYHAQWHPGQWK